MLRGTSLKDLENTYATFGAVKVSIKIARRDPTKNKQLKL